MNFRFSTCALLCASLFLSCHSNLEEEVTVTVPYTFEVFSISTGSLDDLGTRGANDSKPWRLLVLDVKDDKFVQQVERSGDQEYNLLGTVNLDLSFGKHQICFLCSNSPWAEFDEQTFQAVWTKDNPLGDVWSKVVVVNVKQGDKDGSQQVVLDRSVAYVRTTINDKLPENLYSFRQTLQGGSWTYDILHQTGGVATLISYDFLVPEGKAGKSQESIGMYTFLPDGANSASSYTITAYDSSENVLQSHTFTDVPLVQKQYTNYKGNFFSVANQFGISLNKDWEPVNYIEY